MRLALASSGSSRRLLACGLVFAAILLSSCGSAGDRLRAGATASQTNPSFAPSELKDPAERDEDGDIDTLGNGPYDSDNDVVLTYGSPASPSERRAIEAALRRYYVVAAAGEGTRACSMLDPIAAELLLEEHRRGRGAPSLQGDTCGQILSKLFALHRRELREDMAAFRITTIRVRGNHAVVFAPFAPAREMELIARRTYGVWKMDVPLDDGAV